MGVWAVVGVGLAASFFVACSDDVRTPIESGTPSDGAPADTSIDTTIRDGASDAGDLDAATCEASLIDPQNCGRCGHDCLGGACDAGECMPWTVVSEPATDVVSDNVFVYWTLAATGRVARCSRLGCPGGSALVNGATAASAIAVDNWNVYYTTHVADGGTLASCAKGGCDGGPSVMAGGLAYPSRMVIDSNAIFFDVDDSDIFACSLPSCGNGASALVQTMTSTGLAEEWNILYWTEGKTSIWSCAKGNCQTTRKLVIATLSGLGAVGAYGGTVFGVETGANGRIVRCPNAPNCTPAVMAQNLDDPSDIEVDWTGMYFILRGSGSLGYCPQGGCVGAPRILAGGIAGPNALAIDQDAIYVAGANAIVGVAKP
jgi:hypothetical protein